MQLRRPSDLIDIRLTSPTLLWVVAGMWKRAVK
jgi:hypothetical protein